LAEVTLSAANATPEGLRQLETILKAHPGSAPLRLNLQLPEGGQVTIAPAASLTVTADEKLRQALEEEFGAGCLMVK
jgi:hypothetical protein